MSEIVRAALERNDRYLREFVEALNICPFAQRCREEGRLERRVIVGAEALEDRAIEAADELVGHADVEVALLIFPEFGVDADAFGRFAGRVRDRHADEDGFFVVPFHPEAATDVSTAGRAVSLMRRSPDPTLQLVRRSVLDRLRGQRVGETVWMDPKTIDHAVPMPEPVVSISERIARENLETVRRVGLERVVALLGGMRR